MAKIKAFIADVDDTICESTLAIKSDMVKALNRLNDADIKVIFISGSTVDQIRAQISYHLYFDHFLIGTSGSHCVGILDGIYMTVYEHLLPPDDKKAILEAFEELTMIKLISPITSKEDQIQDRGSQITFSALGRGAPSADKKAFDPDKSIRKNYVRFIKDALGSIANNYNINIGGTTSIDVTMKGIDKAYGINEILAIIKVAPEECIFLGDSTDPGGNDYPATTVIKNYRKVNSLEDTIKIIDKIIEENND